MHKGDHKRHEEQNDGKMPDIHAIREGTDPAHEAPFQQISEPLLTEQERRNTISASQLWGPISGAASEAPGSTDQIAV